MAAYDIQEQEQIDDLKAWWNRWGGTISTGVVIAAVVIVGVQGWRWYTGKQAEEASALYFAVSEAGRKNDSARARDAITQLVAPSLDGVEREPRRPRHHRKTSASDRLRFCSRPQPRHALIHRALERGELPADEGLGRQVIGRSRSRDPVDPNSFTIDQLSDSRALTPRRRAYSAWDMITSHA